MANTSTTELDLLKSVTTSGGATDSVNVVGSLTTTPSGTQTVSGSVSVSNFPATQPVSGTVAASQSGTWTVQPGNTANTTAWKVDGSAVTQPVSLPSSTTSGSFTGAQSATISCTGLSTAWFHTSGTWIGTVSFRGSIDGTNFFDIQGISLDRLDGNVWLQFDETFGTESNFQLDTAGLTKVRITSVITSGTLDYQFGASGAAAILGSVMATQYVGQTGTWTVQPGNTANTTPWLVSSNPVDGTKESYSASVTALSPAATATDIFTITGSVSKTIRITQLVISGTATSLTDTDIQLIKRSAANTGGTSSSPTVVPNDSSNAAASATIKAYTANPTVGAAVGTMSSYKLAFVSATAASTPYVFTWGNRPAQSIVLRGTGQVLAVNLNSVTVTGGSIDISIEWTEE